MLSFLEFEVKEECWCVRNAVLRKILILVFYGQSKKYRMLFPERKITTNDIFDWCKIIGYKKRIQRVLAENFELKGYNKRAYYEVKD